MTVHKEPLNGNFLGVNNEVWTAAARDLGAQATLLYMYFADNSNKYGFALSPAAIRKKVGMPESTYRDQFNKLLDKGYLVETSSNHFHFYERPVRVTQVQESCTTSVDSNENSTNDGFACAATDEEGTAFIREINNKDSSQDNAINKEKPRAKEEKCAWDDWVF